MALSAVDVQTIAGRLYDGDPIYYETAGISRAQLVAALSTVLAAPDVDVAAVVARPRAFFCCGGPLDAALKRALGRM